MHEYINIKSSKYIKFQSAIWKRCFEGSSAEKRTSVLFPSQLPSPCFGNFTCGTERGETQFSYFAYVQFGTQNFQFVFCLVFWSCLSPFLLFLLTASSCLIDLTLLHDFLSKGQSQTVVQFDSFDSHSSNNLVILISMSTLYLTSRLLDELPPPQGSEQTAQELHTSHEMHEMREQKRSHWLRRPCGQSRQSTGEGSRAKSPQKKQGTSVLDSIG